MPVEDLHLFRQAVADVTPLPPYDRVVHPRPRPRPLPRQRHLDEHAVMRELLAQKVALEDRLEGGDEPTWLRPGLPRKLLQDLRRGRWVVQAELDLHGAVRDEARVLLNVFIADCRRRDLRVARVIHGRGLRSPGKVGILKALVRGWLMQMNDVLAYCQAPLHDGGEGALFVLIAARPR